MIPRAVLAVAAIIATRCGPADRDPLQELLTVRTMSAEDSARRLSVGLDDPSPRVRSLAAGLAAENAGAAALGLLLRAAQDDHPDVRASAAGALGRLNRSDAIFRNF